MVIFQFEQFVWNCENSMNYNVPRFLEAKIKLTSSLLAQKKNNQFFILNEYKMQL